MSNTNYDVEINLVYDNAYRHYIPTYKVAVPYYRFQGTVASKADYQCIISFDTSGETTIEYYYWNDNPGIYPPDFYYNTEYSGTASHVIPDSGVFGKAYIRNPRRNEVTFTNDNCRVGILYNIKALFEIQFNSTGFAANQNAWFNCSTIFKNTYKQYEWVSATVYYKKSEDSTYSSESGTVSGTWSDVRIDTSIGFEDGYTYDVYIRAVSDDGSVANTPVAQFTTTDAAAIATCIAPVGAFLQGEATFVWSHSTAYGTPQYAYDLQYSIDNGGSWTVLKSHEVTSAMSFSTTLSDAGTYKWRVRTYNSNDVVGEWAEASFINNVAANPPTNLSVNTKGRPTVSWASTSQTAYQVQFLLNNEIVYDSGAVYTSQTSHFVNQYFNDERAYVVRVRIYNALGGLSDWVEVGYQQPSIANVVFSVENVETGGALITINPDPIFVKYYIQRNGVTIGIAQNQYTDLYATGLTNYSVIGVTSDDQSDIESSGCRVVYNHASLITLNGQIIEINKRVNEVYQVQTSNAADISKASFIGDAIPTHYPNKMRLKSFSILCFDDQSISEDILGTVVYYTDNFENGGYCMVTNYEKTDNFVKNSAGIYANEVSLTLEVTNYDDSIKYPL